MRKSGMIMILGLAITIISVRCKKEGPQGPAGPTGPAGVAGPAGPAGPAGTANVIYSPWFTPAQNGGWVDTTINAVASQKKFNKKAPGITLSILNTGLVLTYVKLTPDGAGGTTNSIRQLPYSNPGAANEYITITNQGSITIAHVSTASPGVAVPSSVSTLEFRYLIIPGGVSGGRSADGNTERMVEIGDQLYTESQLKAMPYEEVCSLLNISL